MDIQTKTYRLRGLTEILGSQPAQNDIRTAYIISKNPDPYGMQEEENLQTPDEDRGVTVFLREPQSNALMIRSYTLKGFFKEAFRALKSSLKVANFHQKIDSLVFINPRNLVFTRDGKPIEDEDSVFERVLRANTAQGPRTALVSSELIDTPWELEFTLKLLPNAATKASKALTFEAIESALDYGSLKGLGQFRNGDYGRFTWEEMTER